MNVDTQDIQARSSRDVFWLILCWLGVAVMLYILSTGPVMKIASTRYSRNPPPMMRMLESVYAPVQWGYEKTPLHKLLGMYLHLWVPDRFDSKGNANRAP